MQVICRLVNSVVHWSALMFCLFIIFVCHSSFVVFYHVWYCCSVKKGWYVTGRMSEVNWHIKTQQYTNRFIIWPLCVVSSWWMHDCSQRRNVRKVTQRTCCGAPHSGWSWCPSILESVCNIENVTFLCAVSSQYWQNHSFLILSENAVHHSNLCIVDEKQKHAFRLSIFW